MSKTPTPMYREIACLLQARENCRKAGNKEWFETHTASLEALVDFLPSGSGIDSGVKLDLDNCKPNRLVFHFGYHHTNDVGMYDGWTKHTLTVTPSLTFGIEMRISGPDRNEIKDYLYETFGWALEALVWQEEIAGVWTYRTTAYGHKVPEAVK